MRVGINAVLLESGRGYRQTGVTRYIGELIDALDDELEKTDKLVIFGARLRFISRRPALRIAWEQTGLPFSATVRNLDVFHGPLNVIPLGMRIPRVVTVHDLAFLRYPDSLPGGRRAYMIAATRLSARAADQVIAVSQKTADDLAKWLKLPEDKINVIPEAPSPKVAPVSGASLDVFRMKVGITRPYILAVGTLEPRKNLSFFLRAFASVKDRIPHDLVLVGPEGWMTGEFNQTLAELNLGDRVRLTGFVSDAELGGWYSAADAFVFPSLYEGFGLPTVEAMRCGAPVITSSTSCFPEVVGEAGILVPPTDLKGWGDAVVDVVSNRALNADLRRRSVERARFFSWERTAADTLAVYRKAASR